MNKGFMKKLIAVFLSLGLIPYTIFLIVNKWIQGMSHIEEKREHEDIGLFHFKNDRS